MVSIARARVPARRGDPAVGGRLLRPIVIWAASRLVSTALLATMFLIARTHGWRFASPRRDPSFLTFSGSWDASTYRVIAEHGYPRVLPVDAAGHVLQNPWAFLPGFPAVVRVVEQSGMSFWAAGFLVALVAGGVAIVLLYRLLRGRVGERAATWGTAVFAFGPTGFLLQVSYAEPMFLALLFGALLALEGRRYEVVALLGVLAAFTRPGVLALALTLLVHLVLRWRADGWRWRVPWRGGVGGSGTSFPWRARVRVVVAGLLVAAAGVAWAPIASAVTGRPGAYVATELAFWTGYVGRVSFVPFTPWFLFAGRWLGVGGVVLVGAVLVGAAILLTRRRVRALGPDLVAWLASYGVYLVAVFLPQQSLPRLIMPMAPLLGVPALTVTRARRWTLLGLGVGLQAAAVVVVWFLGYP